MRESAWPTVEDWIKSASNLVEILAPNESQKEQTLHDSQVTVRSPIGAIVYNTGGLLVDQGWLRFPGCGSPRFSRSLPPWNRGRSTDESGKSRGFLLVADDVVGGFFALDGGAFSGATGEVFYFAPDTLRWEPMNDMRCSDSLVWSFSAKLERFYESMRWLGWQSEVEALSANQAFSFYPFLWTKEGKNTAKNSRRPCPVAEIFSLNVVESLRQLESSGDT